MMNRTTRLLAFILLTALVATAYIVQEGDTLWDITEAHLHDPFLWPDVWEKNPHIVNPHLIYPGDSVAIDGSARSDSLLSVEALASGEDSLTRKMIHPSSGMSDADADFLSKTAGLKKGKKKERGSKEQQLYISSKTDGGPRHLNRYLQATAPRLQEPWNSRRTFENEYFFDFEDKRHSLTLRDYDFAILNAGTKEGFQVGDLLEIFPLTEERIELVRDGKQSKWAPYTIFAYAEVIHISKSKARIRIVSTYGTVDPVKCRARKAELPQMLQVESYNKVIQYKRADMAEVIYHHKTARPYSNYGWISVGRGTKQGFFPGDGIAVWEANHEKGKGLPPRLLGSGIVVFANSETATILIKNLHLATRNVETKDLVSVTWKAVVPSSVR